jgi:hypothetical protein
MFDFLRTPLHPERYHGHGKRAPFFEGWYYKLIDSTEEHRYAIIPGVSFGTDGPEGPHSFVQVLDGLSGRTAYHVYPLEAFHAARERFEIHVGPNRFTGDYLELEIEEEPLSVRGRVDFEGPVGWPVTLPAPGIMGWYAWVPFMETYHGVLSFDHGLRGSLVVDGRELDFSGGRGYIEKDWGKSFPSAWVWFQTNHFAEPGTCLTASIAMIPWVGRTFRGAIVGLWHRGTLYRFATYTGAETERLEVTEERVVWVIGDDLYRLEMTARRAEVGDLRGPGKLDMELRVPETLRATVEVRLFAREGDRPLFSGTGRNAGLEVGGRIEQLLGKKG